MLVELDVRGVVLGHSERRELFGETDRALALKVPAALDAGLTPILCVGETEEERDDGDTERKLRQQIQEDLGGVADRAPRRGGDRLRADLGDRHRPRGDAPSRRRRRSRSSARSSPIATSGAAERVRILYGGSVKPENAAELLALPDVDGALVGGASLRGASRSRRSSPRPRDERRASRAAAGRRLLPAPRACLVVLDGWGLAAPGPGQRDLAGRARRCSTSCGRATRTRR